MDNAVEEAVVRDPREHVILEAAKAQGIPTMAQDGIMKVISGMTSLDELERVVDLSNTKTGGNSETVAPVDENFADFASHIIKWSNERSDYAEFSSEFCPS